jgi:hypothetical protein
MVVRAGREFLAIPGPTNMPDEVLRAMHRAALDIYSEQMVELTTACWAICRNCSPPRAAPISTSPTATAPWESALSNVLSRGDKVLVLESGRFAIGWGDPRGAGRHRLGNAPMILGTLGVIEVGLNALDIPHGKGGTGAAIQYLSESVSA